MQTKCPHCDTLFRLTDEQLSVANGKVRCGLCHRIFTASPIDETQIPTVEAPGQSEPSIYNDIPASDINESISADATDDSRDILFGDFETNAVMPDAFRGYRNAQPQSHITTLLWSIGIIFLLATLISQYAWFNRDRLALNPDLEPWISQFCNTTGCTLAPIRKPNLIEMLNRNVYTHPNIKKALMITATIVNKAPQAQAYPDVKIGFSNVRGELVRQRIFTPEEYMEIDTAHLRLLQPDTPITFGLEIQDPGKQAMTYEFNFL